MRCLILVFIIFGSFLEIAHAQSLFEYERIDFFNNSIETQKNIGQVPSKESPDTVVDEWAEPVISPSGKVTIYVPPKEVKDFLETPDPENAKAYLEWNLNRIKKIIQAQKLLAQEAKKIGLAEDDKNLASAGSSSSGRAGLIDNARLQGNHLFYFILKGCPSCQRETKAIEDIYLNHPEIKIEVFASGFSDRELEDFILPTRQDNGMSRYLKISSYPAILVFNQKKEKYFISGYVDKEKMLGLFE